MYDIYELGTTEPKKIFIRPCYHDILKIIGNSPGTKRWTIDGNPGIGKSMFAYLIMSVFLRAGKRIIYRMREFGPISLRADEDPYVISHAEFDRELMEPSTVYVVDGVHPGLPHAYKVPTFLICSPKEAHWHEFMKGGQSQMLYMPVWTLEELE